MEEFDWDLSGSLPLLIKDGTVSYVYGTNGDPIEQISARGGVFYYHQDHLGSTRMLTNSRGKEIATYRYGPYGNLTSSSGRVVNPLLFAGQYYDAESGLYYLRARYYSPITGQFLSVDPAIATTRQPYAYANGSPTNIVDPSGDIGAGLCAGGDATIATLAGISFSIEVCGEIGTFGAAETVTVSAAFVVGADAGADVFVGVNVVSANSYAELSGYGCGEEISGGVLGRVTINVSQDCSSGAPSAELDLGAGPAAGLSGGLVFSTSCVEDSMGGYSDCDRVVSQFANFLRQVMNGAPPSLPCKVDD